MQVSNARRKLAEELYELDPNWQKRYGTLRDAAEFYGLDTSELEDSDLPDQRELRLERTTIDQAYRWLAEQTGEDYE